MRNNYEKVGGKGITLPKASRRRDPRSRLFVDDKGEGGRADASINPRNQTIRKIHSSKGGENCIPTQSVICFLNIKFNQHPRWVVVLMIHRVENCRDTNNLTPEEGISGCD